MLTYKGAYTPPSIGPQNKKKQTLHNLKCPFTIILMMTMFDASH